MKDTFGVSNVIGALMLTLIVVSAATAFAVFTQQTQDEIQKSEFAKLERELENIEIVSLKNPTYNGSSPKLDFAKFIISSRHTKDTKISTMRLNNYLILEFMIERMDFSKERWDIDTSTGIYNLTELYDNSIPGWFPATDHPDLKINAREQIILTIENISTDILKPSTEEIFENDEIGFEIVTVLTNTFSKTFIPPTSIIKVITESQWDSSIPGYTDFLILDGSLSDQPADGYIKIWLWNITGPSNDTITGRKVRAPAFLTDGNTYFINLEVTDNYGMKGSSSITYP